MLRVTFEAASQKQEVMGIKSRRRRNRGQLWLSVGQCAGLVEDGGAAAIDLFEEDWVFDDDTPPRSQRNRADNRDGDANQQWARRSDNQDREKPDRITTDEPRHHRD